MYPKRPVQLLQELVINLLCFGNIEIKDVDLFMNEEIVSYLSQPPSGGISNWDLFSSLVKTKRITVLTADESRTIDEDAPIFSVGLDHEQSRGHAGLPWVFDFARRAYCHKLDQLLVSQRVCRRRRAPPRDRNLFAELLYAILTSPNKDWRKRHQFCHTTHDNRKRFAEFCLRPEKAIRFLEKRDRGKHIVNPTGGFFRTRVYQCASNLPDPERESFENLAQSVYFFLELAREHSAGSYFGRLGECPDPHLPTPEFATRRVTLDPHYVPGFISMIATPDLGDVIEATLEDAGGSMRDYWLTASRRHDPEREFNLAWERVVDAFLKANSKYARERRRWASHFEWERRSTAIESVVFVGGLAVCALKLVAGGHPGPTLESILAKGTDLIDTLHTYGQQIQIAGERAEDIIKSGGAEARMTRKVRATLLPSAGVRASIHPSSSGHKKR